MTCPECEPKETPKGPRREDVAHVSVHFRDARTGARIFLHGQDITDQAVEAIESTPDNEGMAFYYARDDNGVFHKCGCGEGIKAVLYKGPGVTIQNVPWLKHTWTEEYANDRLNT